MQIINLKHPGEKLALDECGLVLGNFDGVHRGHVALIDELKRLNAARSPSLLLGAFCFRTPPAHLLGKQVPQLTDNEEKFALLRRAGLHFVILYEFSDLKDLSPEDFVREILVKKHRCKIAVCGFNYTFGKRGAGKPQDLAKWLTEQSDAQVSIVPPVTDGRHTVSSTVIRTMLERGHPEDATRLLGHPFTLTGKVTRGRQVGRAMGFPTANLKFATGGLVPAHGVYAVTVRVGRKTYCGIANVGVRPTFGDGEAVNCETYLFDFHSDLYGKRIQVSFLHFLRDERTFDTQEALREQIHRDIARAMEYF